MRKALIFLILTSFILALGCIQQDTVAPTYKDLNSNTTITSTGEAIKFSAYWEDDVALDSYIFSWSAGGANCDTWQNFTNSFTGEKAGYSDYVAIAPEACSGKEISWRFYAKDKAGNWNSTEIKKINIVEKGSPAEILYQSAKKFESVKRINESFETTYIIMSGGMGIIITSSGELYSDKDLNKTKVVVHMTMPSYYGGGTQNATFEIYNLPEGAFICGESYGAYECQEMEMIYNLTPTTNLTTLTTLGAQKMLDMEHIGPRTYAGRTCEYITISVPEDKFIDVLKTISPSVPLPEGESLNWEELSENITSGSMDMELCLDREIGDATYVKIDMSFTLKSESYTGEVRETPIKFNIETKVTRLSQEVDPSVFELPVAWEEVKWLPKFEIINATCQPNSNVVKLWIRARKEISGEAKLTLSWIEYPAYTRHNLTSTIGIGSMKPGDKKELSFSLSESLPEDKWIDLTLEIAGSKDSSYCTTYSYQTGLPEPIRSIIPLTAPITGAFLFPA